MCTRKGQADVIGDKKRYAERKPRHRCTYEYALNLVRVLRNQRGRLQQGMVAPIRQRSHTMCTCQHITDPFDETVPRGETHHHTPTHILAVSCSCANTLCASSVHADV